MRLRPKEIYSAKDCHIFSNILKSYEVKSTLKRKMDEFQPLISDDTQTDNLKYIDDATKIKSTYQLTTQKELHSRAPWRCYV